MDPNCAGFTDCVPRSINPGNWINYDPVASWVVNVLIAVAGFVVFMLVRKIVRYYKRPLCVDCLKTENGNKRTRTTYSYKVSDDKSVPVCANHHDIRVMNAEPEVTCSRHNNATCQKEWSHDRIVHRCPVNNCVIAPDGRYDAILRKASNSDSFWSKWWVWWWIGYMMGFSSGSAMHQ